MRNIVSLVLKLSVMKKLIILLLFILSGIFTFAQDSAQKEDLTVWSDQGWILKAKNTGEKWVTFKFTWVTEGRNSAGELVSSTNEESRELGLNPKDEIRIITAPQDPKKEIVYTFTNIVITQYSAKSKEDFAREKMNARMSRRR